MVSICRLFFISRSILYIIRTVCSEIVGLKIQVVFLENDQIIQVSLYVKNHVKYNVSKKGSCGKALASVAWRACGTGGLNPLRGNICVVLLLPPKKL